MGRLPQQVRAAVFVSADAPFQQQMFPRPRLAQGEVLVRVSCCTLCGSDLHTYVGHRQTPTPTILGHEILGEVADLGPGEPAHDVAGHPLKLGDRVSWSIAASCGECFFCRHDLPQKCLRLFKYGHERCDNHHPLSGGLAEYCHLVNRTAIVRVAAEIPEFIAASANCATATIAAVLRAAGGCRDQVVLIQGAGLLGLTACAMAQVGAARAIIVADIDPSRLMLAAQFGATKTIEAAAALASLVADQTEGRGADLVIELSGSSDAVEQGIELVRTGGRYILVGSVRPVGSIRVDPERLVRRMLMIQGIHNYAPVDLAAALDFLTRHHAHFPFHSLIADAFPLEHVDHAFQCAVESRAIRVVVRP